VQTLRSGLPFAGVSEAALLHTAEVRHLPKSEAKK
jgi:hypothetical protein